MHAIADDSRPHILDELADARARGRRAATATSISCSRTTATRRATCAATARRGAAGNRAVERRPAPRLPRAAHGRERRLLRRLRGRSPRGISGAALAEGFAYQGEPSPYRERAAARRAQRRPAARRVRDVPPEPRPGRQPRARRAARHVRRRRSAARRRRHACCLPPQSPMLFMGEEFGAATPFLFFCDFGRELARRGDARPAPRVRALRAFARQWRETRFPTPMRRLRSCASKLDWRRASMPRARAWLALYRRLPRCAPPACRAARAAAHERRRSARVADETLADASNGAATATHAAPDCQSRTACSGADRACAPGELAFASPAAPRPATPSRRCRGYGVSLSVTR